MKRAKRNLRFGMAGLTISSAILILADQIGSKFDVFAVLAPFIVITLVASFNYLKYVKK